MVRRIGSRSLVIPGDQDSVVLSVDSKQVRLTNLRKLFWPKLGLTKGHLLQYYADVAGALLPHLRDRAMVMKRYPHGAAGDFFPRLTGTFDVGFPLPLDHSSIWLRSGASIADGARSNPLANLYLGGFGNNWVDSGAYGGAQRYRELLSMPGFDLDALQGKSLVKSLLEWCLPPVRFESLGSPGFYVSWARPELFVGALETDPASSAYRRSSGDVGAQVDFELHVMHRLPMMLSIGAARGFGGAGLGNTEFMLSLQVF